MQTANRGNDYSTIFVAKDILIQVHASPFTLISVLIYITFLFALTDIPTTVLIWILRCKPVLLISSKVHRHAEMQNKRQQMEIHKLREEDRFKKIVMRNETKNRKERQSEEKFVKQFDNMKHLLVDLICNSMETDHIFSEKLKKIHRFCENKSENFVPYGDCSTNSSFDDLYQLSSLTEENISLHELGKDKSASIHKSDTSN
jgi:hypothetical protein